MSDETTQFTPGPWEWVEDAFWGGYAGIVDANNCEVLFPNHANDGDDGAAWFEDFPSEADARLIAAAPEMYKRLHNVRHVLLSLPRDAMGTDDDGYEVRDALINDITDTLEKAGESGGAI